MCPESITKVVFWLMGFRNTPRVYKIIVQMSRPDPGSVIITFTLVIFLLFMRLIEIY